MGKSLWCVTGYTLANQIEKSTNRQIQQTRNLEFEKSENRKIRNSKNREIEKSKYRKIDKSTNRHIDTSKNLEIEKSSNHLEPGDKINGHIRSLCSIRIIRSSCSFAQLETDSNDTNC